MKYLILLLLCALPLICNAQTTTPSGTLTAGDHLIMASDRYYNGLILSSIGMGLATIGYFDDRKAVTGVGCGVAGIGVIMSMTAWVHVKRAGQKLNSRVSLNTEHGVGIALKL